MWLRSRVGGLLLLVTVVGVACGGGGGASETTTDDAAEPAAEGAGALVAVNFAFDPATLTAESGDTIDFTNEDEAKHNFTAEDAGLDVDVDPSGSTTIDLSEVKAGTYDFYCEYHKDSMTGTLEVTG